MKGRLYLEDGTAFEGVLFGSRKSVKGEVVFNTSMTGYQELLTDPSYADQMVVLTYPQIGNYGFNQYDIESSSPKVNALIVKELCRSPSNFRAEGHLDTYFETHGITGIEGIDTRALTLHIRDHGSLLGMILPEEEMPDFDLIRKPLENPVPAVTTNKVQVMGNPRGMRVAVMDFGVKKAILKELLQRHYCVTLYPAHTPAKEIVKFNPDGILLSNGPGNPADLPHIVKCVKELMEKKIPIMGICLGHQLAALACGGQILKLPFGHRGGNHPVKNIETGKVAITSQNHSYAVMEETLPDELIVTHRNLNDGTIEGLCHTVLPLFSIQYHPEASPGPVDSIDHFNQFEALMRKEEKVCR